MSKYLSTIEQVRVGGAVKGMRNLVVFDDAIILVRGTDTSTSGSLLGGSLTGPVLKKFAKRRVEAASQRSPDELADAHRSHKKIDVTRVTRATLKKVFGGNRHLELHYDDGKVERYVYAKTRANKKSAVVDVLRSVLGDRLETTLTDA